MVSSRSCFLRLNNAIISTWLPEADLVIKAAGCICSPLYVAPKLNCLFAFDGSISCLSRRDGSAIDTESLAVVARQSNDPGKKDPVDAEEKSAILQVRRHIDPKKKVIVDNEDESGVIDSEEGSGIIDTKDRSGIIDARQHGSSGYALNCNYNREFTEFCAGSPYRYYCTADGRVSVTQPGPQAIKNQNCDGKSTLHSLEMRNESC